MEAVTLSELWPIIVAVLGPMLLCVTALSRYQHLDSVKIHKLIAESNEKNRDLIYKSNKETRDETRDLIEKSSQENRDLIRENRRQIEKNRDLIMENHAELGDVRERLARIEGYLRIPPPPHQGAGDGDGNAKAA